MSNIDMSLLKRRVQGTVRFTCFRDGDLFYECEDGWEFPVNVAETQNAQGASPTFKRDDKAITFMRWIRKQMEQEDEWRAEAEATRTSV
jgi:hypothetical protein